MTKRAAELAASILVVDDEVQVLSCLMELLRMQGFGVEGTWDSDEALRLARAHAGPVDLLLTDLVMPVTTGPELAKEIRRIHPSARHRRRRPPHSFAVQRRAIGAGASQPLPVSQLPARDFGARDCFSRAYSLTAASCWVRSSRCRMPLLKRKTLADVK